MDHVAEPFGVGPGQQQQVVDQTSHAPALPLDVAERLTQVVGINGTVALQGAVQDIDIAADGGQGRAKLMRGVRHEPALRLKRAFDPLQHPVEGLRQPRQLVLVVTGIDPGRERFLRVSLAGDGVGGIGDPVDRGQCPPGQNPAAPGRDQDARRATGTEQLVQDLDRMILPLQRLAEHDRAHRVLRQRRLGIQLLHHDRYRVDAHPLPVDGEGLVDRVALADLAQVDEFQRLLRHITLAGERFTVHVHRDGEQSGGNQCGERGGRLDLGPFKRPRRCADVGVPGQRNAVAPLEDLLAGVVEPTIDILVE